MPVAPVSVIIPVYNNVEELPRALKSIADQTVKPEVILICNDGSTDPRVKTYLNSLGKKYEGIPLKVFHQKNAGAGAARNRCLAAARSEFIAFLDADDWWLPEKLNLSLEELRKSGATFVAHDFFAVPPEGEGKKTLWPCTQSGARKDVINRGNPRTHYFYRGFIGILTVVIRREALVKAGGFNSTNRYSLDYECWHAVLVANPGAFFHMFPRALACYSLNPGGLTAKGYARLKEREAYLWYYVKGVAKAGKVAWPLLLLRGWLTVQFEVLSLLLRNRQWANVARLILRAPCSVCRLFWHAAFSHYTRPNFLARISHTNHE